MIERRGWRRWLLSAAALLLLTDYGSAQGLKAGFAQTDITPTLEDGRKVWIAGYDQNRPATGVHDQLACRCVVLDDGDHQIALAAVDLVGLQYPVVQRIRERLPELHYVLVSSTHNHEGPDVIGLWGPSPIQSGVDPKYVDFVVDQVVAAVQQARQQLTPVNASYGTAQNRALLRDSRLPLIFDDTLRVIGLKNESGQYAGLIVQFSNHPESLGSENQQLTADFPHYVVAALREAYHCPVVYFSGAVGGLMTNPHTIRAADGRELHDGNFEFAEEYGQQIANTFRQAIDNAQPVTLTPLRVSAKPVAARLENILYQTARALGVLQRKGVVWQGDAEQIGPPAEAQTPADQVAVETEVAYIRMGQVDIAAIPGELYPELVYGKFQEPAEPNVDYPVAPLEPHLTKILPSDKFLVIGLANDELGYIIPRRQWDAVAPYAYGRDDSQYGEVNSCGVSVAATLMEAMARRVAEARQD